MKMEGSSGQNILAGKVESILFLLKNLRNLRVLKLRLFKNAYINNDIEILYGLKQYYIIIMLCYICLLKYLQNITESKRVHLQVRE